MNMGQAMLAWMLVSSFGYGKDYPVLFWVFVVVLALLNVPSITVWQWKKPAA